MPIRCSFSAGFSRESGIVRHPSASAVAAGAASADKVEAVATRDAKAGAAAVAAAEAAVGVGSSPLARSHEKGDARRVHMQEGPGSVRVSAGKAECAVVALTAKCATCPVTANGRTSPQDTGAPVAGWLPAGGLTVYLHASRLHKSGFITYKSSLLVQTVWKQLGQSPNN